MGTFARVAVPVALSVAAPHAAAGMGLSIPGLTTATWSPLGFHSILPGTSPWVIQPAFSWTNVVTAGVGGLLDAAAYRNQRQMAYNQAVSRNYRIAEVQRQQKVREAQRRDRLKRLIAAERARFGAMGVDSTRGSAAALISGLRKRTENEIALDRQQMMSRRRNLLDDSHPTQQSRFRMLAKAARPMVSLLEEQ